MQTKLLQSQAKVDEMKRKRAELDLEKEETKKLKEAVKNEKLDRSRVETTMKW